MKLTFPNASRSYNPSKHCVRFSGYDSVLEVSFELDDDVLRRLTPEDRQDEAGWLAAFDKNRDQIERVAAGAHARKKKNFHWLSQQNF